MEIETNRLADRWEKERERVRGGEDRQRNVPTQKCIFQFDPSAKKSVTYILLLNVQFHNLLQHIHTIAACRQSAWGSKQELYMHHSPPIQKYSPSLSATSQCSWHHPRVHGNSGSADCSPHPTMHRYCPHFLSESAHKIKKGILEHQREKIHSGTKISIQSCTVQSLLHQVEIPLEKEPRECSKACEKTHKLGHHSRLMIDRRPWRCGRPPRALWTSSQQKGTLQPITPTAMRGNPPTHSTSSHEREPNPHRWWCCSWWCSAECCLSAMLLNLLPDGLWKVTATSLVNCGYSGETEHWYCDTLIVGIRPDSKSEMIVPGLKSKRMLCWARWSFRTAKTSW